jgi:hypothetical protein
MYSLIEFHLSRLHVQPSDYAATSAQLYKRFKTPIQINYVQIFTYYNVYITYAGPTSFAYYIVTVANVSVCVRARSFCIGFAMFSVVDRSIVLLQAKQRAEVDCPICLMPLHAVTDSSLQNNSTQNRLSSSPTKLQPNVGASSKAALVKRQRQVSLLSCSHAFHETCLHALEQFSSEEKHGLTCPVCRAVYQKKLMTSQSSSPTD